MYFLVDIQIQHDLYKCPSSNLTLIVYLSFFRHNDLRSVDLVPSLKLTARPENGWLEDDPFLLGPGVTCQVRFVQGV